ncbi:unnamed protein product [Rotaria sp. Silwood1]|nr:unnamed protein product [Rotaria sp. Silwood1]CAF1339003.1 unnamed protein product [Rotaria sp. Silwood1]CAF3568324.1 unnamed protein product [Rotaria sp. Silwood1]
MKTISISLSQNNHGINQSITTKTLHKNFKYYQNYDPAAGDSNRNATISQIEHERNVCEEELYRLRYGIENLLDNKEQGDFKIQQQKNLTNIQNPFRTMTPNINNLNNRKLTNWFDRCAPCCRRWRRRRCNNNIFNPNEYSHHQIDNDQNYDNPSHRTPKSSQFYSDSFISTSPLISSPYIGSSRSRKKHSIKRSIRKLINRMTPNKMTSSNLLTSTDINEPLYNSLILKILEAKALDCLCAGYSKKNTQKQISKVLNEMNQSIGEQQLDSASATTSPSSSKSSILSDDKYFSSQLNTPQLLNEEISSSSSFDNETPNFNETTSTLTSPDNNKQRIKKPKTNRRIKKKRTKPKSNNQMNDHETVMLPIFMYPQSYQQVYQNRQRLLKLLLS